jgi:replication factor C small subunit
MSENLKLTDKYKPKVWSDVVGQDEIVKRVKDIVDKKGPYPHLLFVGISGTGKTSVAEIFARETGFDVHEFNASDDRTLVFMREKIKSLSQFSGTRIIILDEADMLIQSAQMAMKRIMETTDAIFILCANDEYKIEDAIKSRCSIYRFARIPDKIIEAKIVDIITKEGISVSDDENQTVMKGLGILIKNAKGDLRSALNDLETVVDANKKITPDTIALISGATGLAVLAMVKALEGDFNTAKEMIEKAYVEGKYDPRNICRELYTAIPNLNVSLEIKIRMFEKLGEVEHNLNDGGDPIIQLVTYIAFVWLIPHATGCPLLK